MARKRIIIVGGGPAGLMAAYKLCLSHEVHIYDKEKNVGQKFLLAGKGGFNLTNIARNEELTGKYSPPGFLTDSLLNFDTVEIRHWLAELGIPTYTGSSGRVFPEKGIKPAEVLRNLKNRLSENGVLFHLQHEFIEFNSKLNPVVLFRDEKTVLKADFYIFSLGGASWPITGSTGSWRTIFESIGIGTSPFQSSNCGITVPWPDTIKKNHAGKPLKNIRLSIDGKESKGEAMITETGLEGNAVYPIVPEIRNLLNQNIPVQLLIDFKPFNTEEQLAGKIRDKSILSKDYAEVFHLNPTQLAVIKAFSSKESYLSPTLFISIIKKLPVPVISLRPVEKAISTVGGIRTEDLNNDFSLRKYPHFFTIGEMVDWDAPTGGFLLQASFSMGNQAACSILKREQV